MNVFVAGLPPRASESDLRTALPCLTVEAAELHVSSSSGLLCLLASTNRTSDSGTGAL